MQKGSSLLSGVVICRNSLGVEITANILRIRRYSVAFEIHNPCRTLQFSEVLRDFRIHVGHRVVYQGQAVVAGLVNTRILLVREATLGNEASAVDFPSDRERRVPLADQCDGSMQDWKRARRVAPGGLMVVTNLRGNNPNRAWMEYLPEWNPICRDEAAMLKTAPLKAGQFQTELKRDPTGVNLFLEARKRGDHGRNTT